MQHVKTTFIITPEVDSDVLIAMLSNIGYDGFEETGTELLAYIEEPKFMKDELSVIAEAQNVIHSTEVIEAQNWNALWESNFEPVIVDDFCTIRAHFHDIAITTPYEIIITPKMSFGTGHHATTQLMITLMKDMPLAGTSVLDFGSGTGVLAIMAELLGATDILAIDNDQWCVENAIENVARNNCKHITVRIGSSLNDVPKGNTDVVLANINRHILLQYMRDLYKVVINGGNLLMSGLLVEDEEIITDAAVKAGFSFVKISEQNGWIAMLFRK
ncbi:MAG: hypothetical protein JWQ38_1713 [Flavipsychrobacter sp.]|nr:hypothetical protein [Flavipsychrobacter sp.]